MDSKKVTEIVYPRSIAEVGEEGAKDLLHIAPEDRPYQKGYNDGYSLLYGSSHDLCNEDYWNGYEAGLDAAAAEGR